MGWLITPPRFLIPDPRRLVFLLVGVGAFVATEFGRHIYRPWAYARGLSDFGLADSVGNLGGIIVQIFISVAVFNATRQQSFRIAAFVSLGFVAYEFMQPYLPKGVFDWWDVAATALGYAISCVVLWVIWRLGDMRKDRLDP